MYYHFEPTESEVKALHDAVLRNCAHDVKGNPNVKCGAHSLYQDQNTLARMLFHRRIRERLMREEFKEGIRSHAR